MSSRATKSRKRKRDRKAGDKPFLFNKYSSSDSEGSSAGDEPRSSANFLKLHHNQGIIKIYLFFYWLIAYIHAHLNRVILHFRQVEPACKYFSRM